jgi:hypothetical protein
MTKNEALRLALEALESNRRTHYYCEDTWYSCPKHEDGCANDSEGDECNCGADEANAGIDQAITAIKAALLSRSDGEAKDEPVACWCHKCNENELVNGIPFAMTRMILCPNCGNKRCPKASDHTLQCTNSNKPNQDGSVYTTPPQRTWVGLTDKDWKRSKHTEDFQKGVDWAEGMLKAKNT